MFQVQDKFYFMKLNYNNPKGNTNYVASLKQY